MSDSTADPLPAEFALIAKYFRPLAGPGSLDLSDDAALLTPPLALRVASCLDAVAAHTVAAL